MPHSAKALSTLIRQFMSDALGHELAEDANFFDAGGDSLGAEEVLSALAAHLKTEIPGWLLLDHPTATGLAHALLQTPASGVSSDPDRR